MRSAVTSSVLTFQLTVLGMMRDKKRKIYMQTGGFISVGRVKLKSDWLKIRLTRCYLFVTNACKEIMRLAHILQSHRFT